MNQDIKDKLFCWVSEAVLLRMFTVLMLFLQITVSWLLGVTVEPGGLNDMLIVDGGVTLIRLVTISDPADGLVTWLTFVLQLVRYSDSTLFPFAGSLFTYRAFDENLCLNKTCEKQ